MSEEREQRVVQARLDQARERVVEALCAHFASDHLTMADLESRLTAAYAARSDAELRELVADLPALNDNLDPGTAPTPVSADEVPPRGLLIAVMGGTERAGSWLVPRHLRVIAVMGGVKVDLRQARFAPGVTEIEVFALMGGVEIIVPPGVQVEALGMGVMGGFAADGGDASAPARSQPVLHVTGLAVMGGVEAKKRGPGKKALRQFEKALRAARLITGGEQE